ncbi:hypothetical protein K3495_g1221 [Podosphaera aphanis]|nr:hypothetical protein K3495_g1221 [Podosphaera aphanis]
MSFFPVGLHRCSYGVCRRPFPTSALRRLTTQTRQWSTPLAKQLSEAVNATGPISLATFMRMCLTSDMGGYYTSSPHGRDQFGVKGDFTTSPEISQVFGELIGIWFVAEWLAQGRQSKGMHLIEIGPGRGTLMDDILRVIRRFPAMASVIEAVYLVETSPSLREAQKNQLCGNVPMEETSTGYKSQCKYADFPIFWTENIRFVPSGLQNPFIVAHEFFDALPIHAFQSVISPVSAEETNQTSTTEATIVTKAIKNRQPPGPQWREMVIAPIPPEMESVHSTTNELKTQSLSKPPPEFQLMLSKAPTPHSQYLPESSPRYRALKSTPGSSIEISPESHAYVQEFARRIGGTQSMPKHNPSGAAIIIDYGPHDSIPTNSLRGIREHRRISPLSSPGLVDLSADVDFLALVEAALAVSPGIEVHGPVEQSAFLLSMGIKERAEMLLKLVANDDGKRKRIDSSWKRLIDRGGNGMGKVYKVMAILPENGGKRKPVGFGGTVE